MFFIAVNKPVDASTWSTHEPSAKLSNEASNTSAMSRISFVLDDKMDENTSPIIWNRAASFTPLKINNSDNIETSQLICNANQLTDFYMMGNIGL